MNSELDFYNSLELSLKYSESLLEDAVDNAKSIFHTPTLCISDSPRTVVLREYDKENRLLRFHTDLRSKKIKSAEDRSKAYVHSYDSEKKIQLRLTGSVTVYENDEITRKAWENSRENSKLCYSVKGPPGDSILDPSKYDLNRNDLDIEKGYKNFAVILFEYHELEFLFLKNIGHRRSKFSWKNGNRIEEWLIP